MLQDFSVCVLTVDSSVCRQKPVFLPASMPNTVTCLLPRTPSSLDAGYAWSCGYDETQRRLGTRAGLCHVLLRTKDYNFIYTVTALPTENALLGKQTWKKNVLAS